MRIADLYTNAVQQLKAAAIHDPELEAAVLLGHLLQMTRTELLLAPDQTVPAAVIAIFDEYLARRVAHEPLAYIIGEREFWSLPFLVTPDVLIPRPETEFLLEKVLAVMTEQRPGIAAAAAAAFGGPVLDLGTGSGVIAVVLARTWPAARVYAIDRSYPALRIAARNARRHQVEKRISFINGDWLSAIAAGPVFELVVSNPPYVAREILAKPFGRSADALEPEVGRYEPRQALDGGRRGVEFIERLGAELYKVIKPGGWLFMEIGADQEDFVMERFGSLNRYECLRVHKDYAGLPRVFQAKTLPGFKIWTRL